MNRVAKEKAAASTNSNRRAEHFYSNLIND